ncbi:Coiled-coil domain-containing protein r3hcc1l [Rhizophlyctis rosea]|nr:Coiled-coil domain-containing protein r3hcc1l [Rhizophlyctis rosea]
MLCNCATQAKAAAAEGSATPASTSTSPSSQPNGSARKERSRDSPSDSEPQRKGRGNFRAPESATPKKSEATRSNRQLPTRVYPRELPARVYPPDSTPQSQSTSAAQTRDISPKAPPQRTAKPAVPQHTVANSDDENGVETIVVKLAHASTDDWDGASGEDELEDWERDDLDEIVIREEKPKSAAPVAHPRRTITREEVEALDANKEPTKVLEVYDFPAIFKTHDLQQMFEDFADVRGGFRIKWLEDTRALVIFKHPSTAKSAFASALDHPLAKVRPFTGTIPGSRERSPSPDRARPVTSDMVARRLVAGALGVRSRRKTEEEAAADKAKLQEVKDKRNVEKEQKMRKEMELAAAWGD